MCGVLNCCAMLIGADARNLSCSIILNVVFNVTVSVCLCSISHNNEIQEACSTQP